MSCSTFICKDIPKYYSIANLIICVLDLASRAYNGTNLVEINSFFRYLVSNMTMEGNFS